MQVSAVIPVKRLDRALGRLAGVLPRAARRELQEAMLADVLGALAGAAAVGEIVMVSSDPDAARMAEALGARRLPDHDPPQGMNGAVRIGLAAARLEAALVLTSDLPLVRARDVDEVVGQAGPPGSALIVASAAGTGTNMMVLHPPGALDPELGPASLARHLAQAGRRTLPCRVLTHPRIGLDVDTPADLQALLAARPEGRTGPALVRIGAGEALQVAAL